MSASPLNAALNRNWIAAAAERERLERENADLRKQLAERSGQCEHVERENEMLREVLVAGAEELAEHWDAHCDAEGYGPTNLERRMLECLAVSYPGYSVGAFADLSAKLEEAERDAGRFLWLTADHDDADVRELVVNLCNRLPTMSTSAVRMYIDAAIRRRGKP